LIFSLSSSSEPFPISVALDIPFFDKFIHGIEYMVFSFLLARSIFSLNLRFTVSFLAILTVILTTLYGVSDEIHQMFVPGRIADTWDIFADFLGNMLGILCYVGIIHARKSRNKNLRVF
jgi:VanZ family protein